MPDIVAARPASGAPIESGWGQQMHDAVEGVQAGAGTIPAIAGPVGTLVVTFPRAYAAPPIVVASAVSSSGFWIIAVGAISATQVTLYSSRRDGSNVSAIVANWVAVPAG